MFAWALVIALPACDRVEALLSDDGSEAKTAESDAKKTEGKLGAEAAVAAGETPPVAGETPAPAGVAAESVGEAELAGDGAPTEVAAKPDAAVVVPAADLPCIVGHWEAIEYTEAVRRAINKDPQLRSMKKTSSGGHITYVIDPHPAPRLTYSRPWPAFPWR